MTKRGLPTWIYYDEDNASPEEPNSPNKSQPVVSNPTLIHLLPQLQAFLQIKDPGRVYRAMELLVNCDSEEDLFADLQAQYGDIELDVANERQPSPTPQSRVSGTMDSQSSGNLTSNSQTSRNTRSDVSNFIVPDSEDGSDAEGIEDEDESELDDDWEDDEDDDEEEVKQPSPKKSRSFSQSVNSSTSATAGPSRSNHGPKIVCKYGKSCYRKNPIHFQEFAHPWLPGGRPP